MEKLFDSLKKKRGVTHKQIEKSVKKMLYTFGFDTEGKNFKEAEDIKELEDWRKVVSNTVHEKNVKAPEVGKFRIRKDLFLLREQLRRGKDFYNLDREYLTYDSENFDLYIGEEYINIKPQDTTPAGHHILKYIIENDKRMTYSLDELRDRRVIPIEYNMNTLKQYSDATRGINNKIRTQTNAKIPDFIKVSKGEIKIRDKYTL